jgi:hypothetical protein
MTQAVEDVKRIGLVCSASVLSTFASIGVWSVFDFIFGDFTSFERTLIHGFLIVPVVSVTFWLTGVYSLVPRRANVGLSAGPTR